MKKAIKVIIFTVVFIALAAGAAFGYVKYNQTDFQFSDGAKSGTLEVNAYIGEAKDVTIPGSYKGKKVAYISAEAFKNTDITSVKMPDSIVSIGEAAFSSCKSLKSVSFGKGLEYLGDFAFRSCQSLESITIDSELKDFGAGTFADCTNLKEIKLSDKSDFITVDGVVFSSDKKTAVWSPADTDLAKFDYPQETEKYGPFFFYGHDEITSFDFPNGTTALERGVLAECKNLKSVTIPNTVTKINHSVFYNCASLKTVEIPDSVTSIGDSVFLTDGLKNIDVTLVVKENSYAHTYAKQNKLKYEIAK